MKDSKIMRTVITMQRIVIKDSRKVIWLPLVLGCLLYSSCLLSQHKVEASNQLLIEYDSCVIRTENSSGFITVDSFFYNNSELTYHSLHKNGSFFSSKRKSINHSLRYKMEIRTRYSGGRDTTIEKFDRNWQLTEAITRYTHQTILERTKNEVVYIVDDHLLKCKYLVTEKRDDDGALIYSLKEYEYDDEDNVGAKAPRKEVFDWRRRTENSNVELSMTIRYLNDGTEKREERKTEFLVGSGNVSRRSVKYDGKLISETKLDYDDSGLLSKEFISYNNDGSLRTKESSEYENGRIIREDITSFEGVRTNSVIKIYTYEDERLIKEEVFSQNMKVLKTTLYEYIVK